MSGMSNYLKSALLNAMFRGGVFVFPTETYVALYAADPTDANVTANELAGNGYARVLVNTDALTSPFWTAPATIGGGMKVANNAKITFEIATADWLSATHVGILDASSAGNLLYSGPLDDAISVAVDERATFPVSTLAAALD